MQLLGPSRGKVPVFIQDFEFEKTDNIGEVEGADDNEVEVSAQNLYIAVAVTNIDHYITCVTKSENLNPTSFGPDPT